ncbi:hypothetical protein F5Y16DRAFT_258321 [Xylariaceae sp. FL0255]|nr:hypothetical protein F5Y16DRAFT_258321 [Xylariaceae sp. FL0255]
MPKSGIVFPNSPITAAAFAYTKKHTTELVYNTHCVRSAYWKLLVVKKGLLASSRPGNPGISENSTPINLEAVVLAGVLLVMGWSFNKEVLTTYRRFEVDGAELAREFVEEYKRDGGEGAGDWGLGR